MQNILHALIEELTALTPDKLRVIPYNSIEEGETVLGEVPEGARAMLVLCYRYLLQAEEAKAGALFDSASAEEAQHHRKRYAELTDKARLLKAGFWITVRDELGIWGKPSIAVRANWQVVECPDPGERLPRILRQIMGGDVGQDDSGALSDVAEPAEPAQV